MDRVVKMTETGGNFDKGLLKQNWISIRICGSSDATLLRSGYAGMPGPGRNVAAGRVLLGWLGGEGKGRALGVGEVKSLVRYCRQRKK